VVTLGFVDGVAEGVVEGVVEGRVDGVSEGVVEGLAEVVGALIVEGVTEGRVAVPVAVFDGDVEVDVMGSGFVAVLSGVTAGGVFLGYMAASSASVTREACTAGVS